MTLLSNLYTYRATEARAPTEDFLSEAFREWLALAGQAGIMDRVFHGLLRLPPARCPPAGFPSGPVRWTTQHRIGPGYRGSGKRPDLVGQGEDLFLIIENKITADFTQHEDEDGIASQLELYADYEQRQAAKFGGTVLLTHHTLPPKSWRGSVITWTSVHRWMTHLLCSLPANGGDAIATLRYWTRHLLDFLGANDMTGTRIALSDIVALPAYDRLRIGMHGLADLARKDLTSFCENYAWRTFKVPRGWISGAFNEPQFFGGLLTPSGVRADDASLVIWFGVLAAPAYGISPQIEGIPELSAGVGVWTERPLDDATCLALPETLRQQLAGATPNMNWDIKWKPIEPEDDEGMLVARAQLSLIELYQLAGDEFWDDPAHSFFSTAGKALLTLPAATWDLLDQLKS